MRTEPIKVNIDLILSTIVGSIVMAQEAELLLALSPSYKTFDSLYRRIIFYNDLILYLSRFYLNYKKARQKKLNKSSEEEVIHLMLEYNYQVYLHKISQHIYHYNEHIKHNSDYSSINENHLTFFHK